MRYIGLRIEENDAFALREAGKMAIIVACKHSFLFVLLAAAVGVVANVVQVGFLLSFEPLKPDLKKVNPAEGAKKIFCLKSLACYTVFGYVVIAVGVRYRPDEAPLPKVVCAGMDDVAKEIRAAAVREGVPLMENVELARALYAQVKVEDFIPAGLVEPVAEVLKLVKAMNDAKREDADLDAIDL